jgi:aryl carrier-like protein
VFVMLEQMPLTANGKLDRRALPAPGAARRSTVGYVAAETALQQLLVELWQQTLGLETVGIHDNFFAIGGDSIIGSQVLSRAAQAGLRLEMKDLFEHETIAALARVVTGRQVSAEADVSTAVGVEVALTPIQFAFGLRVSLRSSTMWMSQPMFAP